MAAPLLPRTRRRCVAHGCGALVVALGLGVLVVAANTLTPEEKAVRDALVRGVVAEQMGGAVTVDPGIDLADLKPGPAPERYEAALSVLTTGQVTAAHDESVERLRGSFTGSQLTREVAVVENTVKGYLLEDPTSSDNWRIGELGYTIDGGVSDTEHVKVRVRGDSATVSAEAHIWLREAAIPQDRVWIEWPSNGLDVKAHLVKQDGRWLIDSLDSSFHPGEGP